jgi:hypothetical protein
MPGGRPSKYTDEIGERVLKRIRAGEPIYLIFEDDDLPSAVTFYNWCHLFPEFLNKVHEAEEIAAHALIHKNIKIANMDEREDELSPAILDMDDSNRNKRDTMRINVNANTAKAWNRKRYGDKVSNEHTGEDGGPIQIDKSTMAKRLLFALNEMKRRPQKEDPDAA